MDSSSEESGSKSSKKNSFLGHPSLLFLALPKLEDFGDRGVVDFVKYVQHRCLVSLLLPATGKPLATRFSRSPNPALLSRPTSPSLSISSGSLRTLRLSEASVPCAKQILTHSPRKIIKEIETLLETGPGLSRA